MRTVPAPPHLRRPTGSLINPQRGCLIVFHRQQTSNSFAGSSTLQAGTLNQSRALRLSLIFCLLVSLASLCYYAVTALPQARLLSATPWRSLPQQLMGAVAPRGDAVATKANAGVMRGADTQVSSASLVVAEGAKGAVITYGDRLKITFFESLGVPLDSSGGASDKVVATVFPRMDLSAEYAVDEGGSVNIPKLGQFTVTGRTIPDLQTELAAAFRRAMGRTSDVNVAIVERQPIYVLGAVRNAGTFKHTPGMIVLQALADAGGAELGTADTSKAIEGIRETERMREAADKRDRLLVRQAMLSALLNDADTMVVPPIIKSRLSETAPLNAVIAGAAATLTAERKSYQQQQALAERQVAIARVEIEAQNSRADQLKTLLAKKMTQLHELEEIAARGSVSQLKLTDVYVDISETIARQEDLHVAAAQAGRTLAEAEIAQSKLELEHTVGLHKEIATTEQDINDSTQAIASMQAVIQVLRGGPPEAGAAANLPKLRIMRRVAEGFAVIPATDTTLLVPGDVIQVNSASSPNSSTTGNTQDLQRLLN